MINPIEGLFITQNESDWLFERAQEMESIVEIGSWKGRSTYSLLTGCKGTVHAVDHFRGSPFEINNTEKEAKDGKIKDFFLQNVGHFQNLKLLEMDSMEAAKLFAMKSVDMIFIDADHRYHAVKADIEAWAPKCNKLLCGHDYDRGHPELRQAVDEAGFKFTLGPDSIWSVML